MRISRRAFAVGAVAALARKSASGDTIDARKLEVRSLDLEHPSLLALPVRRGRAPLVVLLHGLGETTDAGAGANAWLDRYGIASAVERLRYPPLARVSTRDDWGVTLATTNAALAEERYQGLAFVCPYVPRMTVEKLDDYARWIDEVLVPRARAEAGNRVDASPARIGGCSYGGWVSLEVFLRAPGRFGTWAGVQTAIGRDTAAGYAERLSRAKRAMPLLVETSLGDPFHDANVALNRELIARGVPCDLLVLPGPHDQAWLRESGTPCLLAWLDRARLDP
jgi:pimeloyl-ACP methyl ester carboxylesterase